MLLISDLPKFGIILQSVGTAWFTRFAFRRD